MAFPLAGSQVNVTGLDLYSQQVYRSARWERKRSGKAQLCLGRRV